MQATPASYTAPIPGKYWQWRGNRFIMYEPESVRLNAHLYYWCMGLALLQTIGVKHYWTL
jgi:hypothetical protein